MIQNFIHAADTSSQSILFGTDCETYIATLHQRISKFEISKFLHIEISDKWLLASALQKCIRRGLALQSVAIAIRLHQIDQVYLPRRMPIIALEDIGLGDALVCHDVIAVCASSKWWGADVNRTIGFLASIMAGAVKSRTACDAFSLTEVHSDRNILLPNLLKCSAVDLIDMACDRDLTQIERLFALRVLGGITENRNGAYKVLSRCDIRALESVGSKLELPEVVCWLIARQRKTAGMAAMLPIAFEAGHNAVVRTSREFPRALDNIAGLPLCTLDMYTKLGRTALKRFYQTTKALQDFASQHVRGHDPQPLINLAMFQTESSLLNQFLSSPKLDDLKDITDEAEMECLGMVNPANRHELYRLLRENSHFLADIRIDMLKNLFLMQEGKIANPPVQLTLNGC